MVSRRMREGLMASANFGDQASANDKQGAYGRISASVIEAITDPSKRASWRGGLTGTSIRREREKEHRENP